jgi:hypothetical protein
MSFGATILCGDGKGRIRAGDTRHLEFDESLSLRTGVATNTRVIAAVLNFHIDLCAANRIAVLLSDGYNKFCVLSGEPRVGISQFEGDFSGLRRRY